MSGGGALWETWGPVDSIYSQQQHLHGCTFSRGPRPNLGRRVCVTVNSQEVIPGSLVRSGGMGSERTGPARAPIKPATARELLQVTVQHHPGREQE